MHLAITVHHQTTNQPQWVTSYHMQEREIIIGSCSDAQIQLKDLPEKLFSLHFQTNGSILISPLDQSEPIKVSSANFTGILTTPQIIPNGSRLIWKEYEFQIFMFFPYAPFRKGVDYQKKLSIALVILLILFQVSMIIGFPKLADFAHYEGIVLLREQIFFSLDQLRNQITNLQLTLGKQPPDEYTLPILEMYQNETNRFAMYLRQYANSLSAQELSQCQYLIKKLAEHVQLIQEGRLLPPTYQLDISTIIQKILSSYNKQKIWIDEKEESN